MSQNKEQPKLNEIFRIEFLQAQQIAKEKIAEQMTIAVNAITQAVALSEALSVPFYATVSPLGQSYRPFSMEEKWGEENMSALQEYSYETGDENFDFPEYEGWQHSSVC